jgi:Zn-dependent M16 (insulinase) family peptidase
VIGKLNISGKAVRAKSEKMIQLAAEYALRPVFNNHQRIKQLIREQRSRMEMSFMGAGHGLAVQRLFSPFSPQHRRADLSEGLGYYHFLCDLESSFENGMEQIVEELQWVKDTFFTQQKLIISLTGERDDIDHAFAFLSPMLSEISNEAYAPAAQSFDTLDMNEGIYAPLNVQFCAKGGNFFRKGYSYSGKLRVLNNILKNDFLYNEIRVKGGAYGNISNFTLSGFQYFVSYRDPNLEKTLDVYDAVADFLRNYSCSRRDLEKFIIGDMAILDYPNTPERKGAISDEYYMTGFTFADKQQIRDEVLSTKLEDIVAYADMIEALMCKNHYCVVGNEARIKASAQLFDRITPIFR